MMIVSAFLFLTGMSRLQGFVTPKAEFLLDIDGNSVSTSTHTVCAIEQKPGNEIGGRVSCWSHDDELEHQSPADLTFVQVVSGSGFSCGLTVDRTVHCWGGFPNPPEGYFTQLSAPARGDFVCGLQNDASLFCWGNSRFVKDFPRGGNWVQVSCSASHCCALDDKGYPRCWGQSPVALPPTITYEQFLESKKNYGWIIKREGEEDYGDFEEEEEEGEEERREREKREQVSLVQFRQLSVTEGASCGITLLGSHLLCWGVSLLFKQGLPREVPGPFRQVSLGRLGLCAITGGREEGEMEEMERRDSRGGGEGRGDGYEDEYGEEQEGREEEERDATSLSPTSSTTPAPLSHQLKEDQLVCFSHIKNLVDPSAFDAWDQISVGSSGACGVGMESELKCFGPHFPKQMHSLHRDFVVA